RGQLARAGVGVPGVGGVRDDRDRRRERVDRPRPGGRRVAHLDRARRCGCGAQLLRDLGSRALGARVSEAAAEPDAASNEAAFARAQAALPGGVNSPVRAYGSVGGTPRFLVSAQGAYVTDVAGRQYVD